MVFINGDNHTNEQILHELEIKVLDFIVNNKITRIRDEELAKQSRLPLDSIYRIISWLEQKNVCKKEKLEETHITIKRIEHSIDDLPELKLMRILNSILNHEINIEEIKEEEIKVYGIQWAKKNNWISISQGKVKALVNESLENLKKNSFYVLLEKYAGSTLNYDKLLKEFDKQTIEILKTRGFATISKKSHYIYNFDLELSKTLLSKHLEVGKINLIEEYSFEILAKEEWKNREFKKYKLTKDTDVIYASRRHIISRFADRIRNIFLALGFEEMEGNIIELSLWNFDALFQPQDHPARDLADTFYFNEKGNIETEIDKKTLNNIKKTHEIGWKDEWKIEEASRYILRTHDTCVSAKTLYSLSKLPKEKRKGKFFQIEKVFRNEATDFKHLAEFYQVGGIIVSEDNNLAKLFGILSEFYKLLGFEQIRFRPSYFPYTEPSLEIEVYMKERKQWIELGGAGIFRPEVSIPLCDVYPVIAWGLSLERPLMLMNNLDDIRKFYNNDMNFLWAKKYELKT